MQNCTFISVMDYIVSIVRFTVCCSAEVPRTHGVIVDCWMMSVEVMCELLAVSVHTLAVRAMQPNSQSQLNIITNTLGSAESAYSQDCANLKHLPEAMARHVCEKYRHVDLCVYTHLRELSHGPHDQAAKTG